MKFYIYSNEELVGWTELKITDASMGCVGGTFYPEPAYQTICSVIKERWDLPLRTEPHHDQELSKWELKRAALKLKIVDGNGVALHPVGMNINDFIFEGTHFIEVEVYGLWWHEMEKYSPDP
jgi:hypothetical protein